MPLIVRRTLFLLAISLIPMTLVLWHGQTTKRDLGDALTNQSVERVHASLERSLLGGLRTAAEGLASQLSQTAFSVEVQARAAETAMAQSAIRGLQGEQKQQFILSRLSAAADQLAAQVTLSVPWRAMVFADQDWPTPVPEVISPAGTNPRDSAWYRNAAFLGGTVWDGPRPGPDGKGLIVIAATPVRGTDQALLGVSAAAFDVEDTLQSATSRIDVEGVDLSVVQIAPSDPNGTALQTMATSAESAWADALPPEVAALLADEMTMGAMDVRAVAIEGVPFLVASEPVLGGAAHMVGVVSYDAIAAVVRDHRATFDATTGQQLLLTGTLAAFVIIIVALVALTSARIQARPIQELVEAVRRVGRGDFTARLTPKRGDEMGRLAIAFNRLAPALADRLKMRRDLDLAEEVQAHLLPQQAPSIPGLDVAFVYQPSDQMGGDYIDFLETRFGHVLLVGDVTGHGAAAALLMATARAFVRAHASTATDVGDLLTRLNADLAKAVSGGRFMTAFCISVSLDGQTVSWAGAGHHPAILLKIKSGDSCDIEAEQIPLGIDPTTIYVVAPLPGPSDGWLLCVATDGVEENLSPHNQQMGRDAIVTALHDARSQPAEVVLDALLAAHKDHAAGTAARDDVTILIVKKK